MKILLIIPALLAAVASQAQTDSRNSQSFSGQIVVPVMQTVKTEVLQDMQVTFDTPEEIESGKLIKSYCRVTVISNVPWVIHVKSNTLSTTPGSDGAGLSDIFSVKNSSSSSFIPLVAQPGELFRSNTNQMVTVFYVDVRVRPSVSTKEGRYDINLSFSVSPQ